MPAPASLQNTNLIDRLKRIILRQKPETLESDLTAMRDRPDSTELLSRIGMACGLANVTFHVLRSGKERQD